MFSYEFCEISKNTLFCKIFWKTNIFNILFRTYKYVYQGEWVEMLVFRKIVLPYQVDVPYFQTK